MNECIQIKFYGTWQPVQLCTSDTGVQFKGEPYAFTQLRLLKDLCGDLFILIVAETLWVHKIRLIVQLADSR